MVPVLIVDGYNIIGAWPEFQGSTNLEESRGRLSDMLADYAAFAGLELTLVFDGHSAGRKKASEYRHAGIAVVFTKEDETADQYIERMTDEFLRDLPRHAYQDIRVATSDLLEQSVIFSRGAVRVSARELRRLVLEAAGSIRKTIEKSASVKTGALENRLSPEQARILERLRRM